MRRILVLNLSRMGDLVQSVPFLTALKNRPEPTEVHLLVEKAFASVTPLLPSHDAVHVLSHDEILPPLHQAVQTNLLDLYHLFRGALRTLQGNFDEVWNLTHTRPSMILTHLLGGERGRGVTVDERGFQLVRSPWLRYFFATNLARPYCQFNLVDIYAQCAGPLSRPNRLELIPERDAERFADRFFSEQKLEIGKVIAFQLGAAHPSKRWPVESFRRLANRIGQKLQRPIILLGHKTEKDLAASFEGMPGVFSLVGQTTIPQLFSILRRCRLLISNDTGTIHLAAGAGLPIIAITLGTALGSETAPYGEGHIVIEPDVPCFPCSYQRSCATRQCHEAIQPDTVFEILCRLLECRDSFRNIFPKARVYATAINPQDYMLELRPLVPAEPSLRDQLQAVVRPLWRRVLGASEMTIEGEKIPVNDETMRLNAVADRALPLARRALAELERMSALCREKPQPVKSLWRSSQTLAEIDKILEATLDSHALLRSFWGFTALTKASIENGPLDAQVNETRRAYCDLDFLLKGLKDSLQEKEITSVKYENRKESCHEGALEWS